MALNNLLENGAKYSTGAPKLEIVLQEKGSNVILSVKDHGVGIPPEHLERIFERFYRIEGGASPKKLGSSGLGLSIVQTIIEKHFGKISVTSKQNVGTTFTIELPKTRPEII
jgi:two-component system phosphate regulon sensor histidine kinase PhoR